MTKVSKYKQPEVPTSETFKDLLASNDPFDTAK